MSRDRRALCRTPEQRATYDRLVALNKDAWPDRVQGKTIVAQARRYFETCDPKKIENALYLFSIHGAGGFNDIAHYNLHGFRAHYPHPTIYLHELLGPEVGRWPLSFKQSPDGYHSFYVYTDGMHAGEVAHAIVALANENALRLLEDFRRRVREKQQAEFDRLVDDLGIQVFAVQEPLVRKH